MADLTITATSVVKGANAKISTKYALETITAGQSVYVSTTDATKVGKHDSDGAAPLNNLYGVALNGGSVGQAIAVQTDGEYVAGATVVVGAIYLGSDTAGGIRPAADANSGDSLCVLGYGKTATTILLDINNTGITVA